MRNDGIKKSEKRGLKSNNLRKVSFYLDEEDLQFYFSVDMLRYDFRKKKRSCAAYQPYMTNNNATPY